MKESELVVLNSAISKPEHLHKLMQYDKSIFLDFACQTCYEILRELYNQGIEVSLPVFTMAVQTTGKEKIVRIPDFVEKVSKLTPAPEIDYLLKQLSVESYKNQLLLTAKDLAKALNEKSMDYEEFVRQIIELQYRKDKIVDSYYDMQAMVHADPDEIFSETRFIKTGFPSIDSRIHGLFDGQIIMIAGRPGTGKTTLALNIALFMKQPGLFISLEMLAPELFAKILSIKSEVPSDIIESRKFSGSDIKKVLEARKYYQENPLQITVLDDTMTMSRISARIRQLIDSLKCRWIIVDYVQVISGLQGATQNDKIGWVSRSFKLLAMEHKIPIILLSQLSRDVEKSSRKPVLSDLRDSGCLEQDASVVMFLYEDKDGNTIVDIAKNRKGRIGDIKTITFEKEYSRFVDQKWDRKGKGESAMPWA